MNVTAFFEPQGQSCRHAFTTTRPAAVQTERDTDTLLSPMPPYPNLPDTATNGDSQDGGLLRPGLPGSAAATPDPPKRIGMEENRNGSRAEEKVRCGATEVRLTRQIPCLKHASCLQFPPVPLMSGQR